MSIKKRVMDYLAKRDHSEKELKLKLSRLRSWENKKQPLYSKEEIEAVLLWAKTNKWLVAETALAERWSQALDRKKKGIHFINAYLNQKGLPPVKKNEDVELEKAIELLKRKIGQRSVDLSLKIKLKRFLLSRGFDSNTIKKAVSTLT
ncbi:MAG: recombination regulator RecX [Bdellovibrionaceae bacterium]|nr:recombination regulator RecX [Pseudobdellovibrionaceae bacterium]NUM57165.1 regulatory protein RecX [Pseudobdellovibrionaceae bacterium]